MTAGDSDNLVFRRRKRRPGLHDLAQKLGVSHTAVARALRNDPKLSESLRQRAHAVAREEGYLASDVTQSLVSGRSGTIGLVVPTLESGFVSRIVNGVTAGLWQSSAIPMVLCSQFDVTREEKMLEALGQKRVDGVIIVPCREDRGEDHFMHLLNHHTPIVAVNNPLPQIDAPVIASDDQKGAEQVVRHLIERGHRHIMHLGTPEDNPAIDRRRERAYRRAMEDAGLEPHVVPVPTRDLHADEMVRMLETVFDSQVGRKVTAVFAFNDPVAYHVYSYAQRHGQRIGQDLALAGFGNTWRHGAGRAMPGGLVAPALTTVEQHPMRVGETAAAVLQRMIEGEPVQRQTLIEPEFLPGASTGATADHA